MELSPLFFVPTGLVAGFLLRRAFKKPAMPAEAGSMPPRRWRMLTVPIACLAVWVGLCLWFKLLTWRPFGGDATGSVAMTDILLLGGSAFIGAWISARWSRRDRD